MSLTTLFPRQQAIQFLISQLRQLNKQGYLTDAKIGSITSSGTVAKLRAKIAALSVREVDIFYRNNIDSAILRCFNQGTLTNAMVETARAAGTYAALITAITAGNASLTLVTTQQPYQMWCAA